MLTHYADLTPCSGRVIFELYGRTLKVVHLTAQQAGYQVVVDWPGWKENVGGFGPVIRLLGPKAAIERCLSHLAPLIDAKLMVQAGEIQPVPECAEYIYGYRRSRKQDKNTPCHQRRLERRAKARGQTPESCERSRMQASHFLPMQSKTNGQPFSLCIKRVPASTLGRNGAPCSYGLGIPLPKF